eukprot:XP_023989871.1 putative methyl-CpG-binding domain protein 3-like 3 [Physeter catodon]
MLPFILFSQGKLKRNLMTETLEKTRQDHLAKAKQRHRDGTALPMRLTSCIFKRQVTKITSHPDNAVRRRRCDGTLEKPQQVCAFRRLQGLQVYSPEGEPFSTLDSAVFFVVIALRGARQSLGRAGAGSLHTSPEAITTQSSDGAEMIPGLGLFLPQTLCRQRVTYADIRRQSRKVKRARERLDMALRADRLARETERARSPDN